MDRSDIAGFILLGGKSSRMGADKALLTFRGQPLAALAAARVREAAGSATLVGPLALYGALGDEVGCPVIEDTVPGRGPLSGIHAVLAQSGARWNLIVPCDLPFLTADFMRFLLSLAASGADGPGKRVPFETADPSIRLVVPVSERGYELVVAVRSDALAAAETAMAARENKLSRFYARVPRRELLPAEYAQFDPRGMLFENLNTQEDLDRATKNLPQAHGDTAATRE